MDSFVKQKLINWNLECLIEKFAGKYVMNNFEFQILLYPVPALPLNQVCYTIHNKIKNMNGQFTCPKYKHMTRLSVKPCRVNHLYCRAGILCLVDVSVIS